MDFRNVIRRIPVLAAGIGLLLRASAAHSSLPIDVPVTARSVSGQFVVHGGSSSLPAPVAQVRRVGTNDLVRLRPDLLVVTAERVKQGVERLLGVQDAWRGMVHLQLRDAVRVPGPLSIQARVFRDGWQYYILVPDEVSWERLVRGLTEVVLLERANRGNPTEECVLVPLWLTTGLNELLMGESGRDLVTESGTLINRSERRQDPLRALRAVLEGSDAMSFTEMSLATPDQLGEPARFAQFQASAALFTHELLQDEHGRSLMVNFIRRLPENLNWQITFLRVYGERFPRLLDVEKWWAVASAEVLASDSRQQWTRERVLERLAELLVETVDVRADTNSPAVRQDLPLRDLIVTWDFDSQRDVVRRKASQIRALGLRSPAGLAPLVGDSARVLEDYLAVRGRTVPTNPGKSALELRGRSVAEATARKLAALELRIERERRNPPPGPSAPANPKGAVTPPGRASTTGSPSFRG